MAQGTAPNPISQELNPLHPYTEFDLVEGFAEECGSSFAYVASRGQWFCRSVGDDGQPFWEPDELSKVIYFIRLVLLDLAKKSLRPNPNLCTAATVRAVEELARSDPQFAITEADLAPGALAKIDAEKAKFLECLQRDRGAKQAAPGPAQSTAAALQTPKPRPRARSPKPKPANPAPTVDNPGITTTPRSLMDDMARWAAVGSAA